MVIGDKLYWGDPVLASLEIMREVFLAESILDLQASSLIQLVQPLIAIRLLSSRPGRVWPFMV
jgi:hypothetical protein